MKTVGDEIWEREKQIKALKEALDRSECETKQVKDLMAQVNRLRAAVWMLVQKFGGGRMIEHTDRKVEFSTKEILSHLPNAITASQISFGTNKENNNVVITAHYPKEQP